MSQEKHQMWFFFPLKSIFQCLCRLCCFKWPSQHLALILKPFSLSCWHTNTSLDQCGTAVRNWWYIHKVFIGICSCPFSVFVSSLSIIFCVPNRKSFQYWRVQISWCQLLTCLVWVCWLWIWTDSALFDLVGRMKTLVGWPHFESNDSYLKLKSIICFLLKYNFVSSA